MITHIRVKNFKSWQDSGGVELAPLTGFFGTNSSGKSSLLQMLLSLKQTVGRNEVLFFGDEKSLVNLGNFQEVIHGHEVRNELYLGLNCRLSHTVPYDFVVTTQGQMLNFSFSTVIREVEGNQVIKDFRYNSLTSRVRVVWEDNNLFVNNQNSVPIQVQNCYGLSSSENADVPEVLTGFISVFEELFSHVYYLGPTRIHPQRHYHWNDKDPTDVGLWGDKVIDALLCAHMRRVKIAKKGEAVTIEDRVSEWLRELDLAYSFSLEPVGALKDDNYEVRIQKNATSPAVTLADIGYGLADVLPMLVLCYYTPEGSTLILEQPGIHLHPKAQADLADLLIEVITERNLQILIESHSEHLLNRLQRRVAEEKIAADQTALYFCRYIDGASKIDRLEMDEFGNIANWPENFFGDEMGDLFAMTEAQREREKRETGLIEGPTIAPSTSK
ncbi:DUF3696 domain-containing protein [Candidatus Poribacteria bacterium]|nr:DUF3696 domain-containing protein [Candidatus Poribacteria bacterium]